MHSHVRDTIENSFSYLDDFKECKVIPIRLLIIDEPVVE